MSRPALGLWKWRARWSGLRFGRGPPTQGCGVLVQVYRVDFKREVENERDVRSTFTMLAQHAWERERTYIPIMPPTPDPVSN